MKPNGHIIAVISSGAAFEANDNNKPLTTELDYHANMVVVGANATVIQETGTCADVNTFANEVDQMKRVPIKDMVVVYDCPYQCKMFLLIFKNALHVPSMDRNLISPFIMEEAGVVGIQNQRLTATMSWLVIILSLTRLLT